MRLSNDTTTAMRMLEATDRQSPIVTVV